LPTPSIGGLPVIPGGFLGAFTLDETTFNLVSFLTISALPIFLGGLGEHVEFNVSAIMRLVLSFASDLLAGMLFGAWIPRMGVPVLEILTLYTFPAIILTLLISGGFSHLLNLIDGLNGLAIGMSIVIALVLMSVAVSVGDYQISYIYCC
jgi:UDP-GlcNAc:undecaprenyl-phosphate GlcNAc-1-phosphate transferase